MMDINTTLYESSQLLETGQITSTQIVESLLKRVDKVENKINAFSSLNKEQALIDAKISDERRKNGKPLSVYDGLAISLKDNMVLKNSEARCGSSILKGLRNIYDAFVVQKMKEAGVIIFGQTNMDEFAMGSTTQTCQIGKTSNPYDLNRVPGGSSGGSAAAVASSETLAALGSDTGGSIRQPAAFCGTVGLKPSYGRVSRNGLVAFASSLDQIGPITKDVRDSAFLLQLIAGHDNKDYTSHHSPVPNYTKEIANLNIKNLKIAIPDEYFSSGLQDEVKNAIENCIELFKSHGAKINKVSLPYTEYCIPTYYIIATAEASTNLARFDGMRYGQREKLSNEEIANSSEVLETYIKTRNLGFGDEVKRRLLLGTFVLSSGYADQYYKKALKMRELIKQDFTKVFEHNDIILTPTTPSVAFQKNHSMNPVEVYLADIFTVASNISGICAISLPCAYSAKQLPIGLQIIAPFMDELKLLQTAYYFEQNSPFKKIYPIIK